MDEGLKQIIYYEQLLFQLRYENWISTGVFSIRWWVLLICLTVPWLIWYWLIDKRRILEMFLYILATSHIAVMLDWIGLSLGLWIYPVNIVPYFPQLITANYTLVPIIFTLMYQYFPRWKSFIIANVILAVVFSFVFEPILLWVKLYVLITWKHIYSVPLYFTSSVILKLFIEKLKSIQTRYRSSY